MISISEARSVILKETGNLPGEAVSLDAAVGRILAADIRADRDLPPFDRSQMDGFAVLSGDTAAAPVSLRIVGVSAAGKGWHHRLSKGEAVRIMTGAPVPHGADAVQKVELTKEDGEHIHILESVAPDRNVVRKGTEIQKGDEVLSAGEMITPSKIASLASFGCSQVVAARRPRMSILSTGSEVVGVDQHPGPDQIRNSNAPMIRAFARKIADVSSLPITGDDPRRLKRAVSDGLKESDCLVISGGVSVGDYDFTKPVLRELGAKIVFEKLALKPGKPTVFAKLDEKIIFGLPGNPVSMAVTYLLFVRLALLKMQGAAKEDLPEGTARVTSAIKGAKGRDSVLPVRTRIDMDGRLTVESLRFSGSSNFVAFSNADALVFVPMNTRLQQGDKARVFFIE